MLCLAGAGTVLELHAWHGSIFCPEGPSRGVEFGDKAEPCILHHQPLISKLGLPPYPMLKEKRDPTGHPHKPTDDVPVPAQLKCLSPDHRDGSGSHQHSSRLSRRWQMERSSPPLAPWPSCFHIP